MAPGAGTTLRVSVPLRGAAAVGGGSARHGIVSIIEEAAGFEVVGEAADGEEALAKARSLRPDLVLMDIQMPGMGGIEATRRLKREMAHVKVVMLSMSDDVQDFFEAIKAGAQGYLLKNMQPESWVEYLAGVVRGAAPISQPLAARTLREFAAGVAAEESEDAGLTAREREVLELVAQGLSNREIAARLYLAEPTVKNHLSRIMEKLHLRNRTELAAFAHRRGWVPRRTTGRHPGDS